MMPGKIACHWEAKLCVARRAFKHDVLRILLSDFDDTLKETRLGVKVSRCAGGMSVVIMSAEYS